MQNGYKTKLIALLFVGGGLTSCQPTAKQSEKEDTPTDTLSVPSSVPDSTLWGHLSDGTGMSVLEFVTDRGDTLEIYRTNQLTGEDGRFTGDLRNLTDRYAITVDADGESLLTAINVSQLTQEWCAKRKSMQLEKDGSITCQDMPYHAWQLWNGHILLSSTQQSEYGAVNRTDTMEIVRLDNDSLLIRDHLGQLIRLGRKHVR